MQSHHIINVSKNGKFYFRVKCENVTQKEVLDLAEEIAERWKECEVSVTYWEVRGESVARI